MQLPTPNLNGTSKDELIRQLTDVCAAINNAIAATHAAMPNARDYTPQGSEEGLGKHKQAVSEMLDRVQRLRAVKEELLQIVEHIDSFSRGR